MANKEYYEIISMKIFLYFVVFIIVGLSTYNIFHKFNEFVGVPDDNLLEEMVEDIIEHETGIEIDLT